MAYPHSLAHQRALIAGAWVALDRGDLDVAAFRIGEAAALARARNDQAALAECHEVEARLAPEAPARLERLGDAREVWYAVRSPIGLARVELAMAAAGAPGARDLLRTARARAQVAGARSLAAAATSALHDLERAARPSLSIETLGRFRVVRRSGAVAPSEWQSRKARDLLKVLVARRGRPVTRDELVELLWGEEADPERSSARLSVALSTLRSVLDPEKSAPADRYVASDRTSVRLELDHVSVDVEQFMEVARSALAGSGSGGSSGERLREADVLYGGDFLPDDSFADWAAPLRDETRRLHAEVLRALAASAAGRNDEAAARCLLRLLEHDPYDEAAHLGVVVSLERLRRHGEARRAYRAYCTRMEEIDVEPAGFPT
jgi:DNA-binding SARP family transcriptional activator